MRKTENRVVLWYLNADATTIGTRKVRQTICFGFLHHFHLCIFFGSHRSIFFGMFVVLEQTEINDAYLYFWHINDFRSDKGSIQSVFSVWTGPRCALNTHIYVYVCVCARPYSTIVYRARCTFLGANILSKIKWFIHEVNVFETAYLFGIDNLGPTIHDYMLNTAAHCIRPDQK